MAQPHTESGHVIAIAPLGAHLRSSRTAALLKAQQLEVVRLVLPSGKGLPEHAAPGEITVLCIEGCIEFTTPSGAQRMRAGDFIHLQAGVPHALSAIDDASLLLTICLANGTLRP
jgi:quercetin dioxygenase-like cupin family protein